MFEELENVKPFLFPCEIRIAEKIYNHFDKETALNFLDVVLDYVFNENTSIDYAQREHIHPGSNVSLVNLFSWSSTKQGHGYWHQISNIID